MKRFVLSAAVVLIFLLSSIQVGAQFGPPTSTPLAFDWCYFLDFTQTDYNATYTFDLPFDEQNFFLGLGISNIDPTQLLGRREVVFQIYNALTTHADTLEFNFSAANIDHDNINLELSFDVFGITRSHETFTFIPGLDTAHFTFPVETVSDASNLVAVDFTANDQVYLTNIIVKGYGVDPFPPGSLSGYSAYPCAYKTATPTQTFTASPTSSNTPTPSNTPTASPSATPTATATQSACTNDINLRTTQAATITSGNGFWESGFGYRSGTPYSDGFTTGVRLFARVDLWAAVGASVDFSSSSGATLTVSSSNFAAWTINGLDDPETHSMSLLSASGTIGGESLQTNQGFSDPTNIQVRWLDLSAQHVQGSTTPYIGFATLHLVGTCYPISGTATPSLTPTASQTLTPSATVTPFPSSTPSQTPLATRTPIVFPPTFTLPPLGTLPPTTTPFPTNTPGGPTPTIAPTEPPGGGGGGGLPTGILDQIIGLLNGILGTLINLFNQVLGWLSGLSIQINAIVVAWNTATPTPIGGTPHCATDRFASEVCAIYYFLSFTLLAPGTLGAFIMPVATAGAWATVLFAVIKQGIRVLKEVREILRS